MTDAMKNNEMKILELIVAKNMQSTAFFPCSQKIQKLFCKVLKRENDQDHKIKKLFESIQDIWSDKKKKLQLIYCILLLKTFKKQRNKTYKQKLIEFKAQLELYSQSQNIINSDTYLISQEMLLSYLQSMSISQKIDFIQIQNDGQSLYF